MKLGIVTNAVNWRSHRLQGKMTYQGLPISIENERGSYRRGTSPDGHFWRTFMHMPYGYIRLTEGTDGDHVDCYVGPNKFAQSVFVIHQQDPKTKKYDEDKVLLGMNSAWQAKTAYLRQYDSPGFFQSMEEMTMESFKEALKTGKGIKLKKTVEKKRLSYTGTTHAESAGNLGHTDSFTIKSKSGFSVELPSSRKPLVKPSIFKRFIDGKITDSELDGDVLETEATLSKSNSLVDVPRKTGMGSLVHGRSSKHKIVDSVVQPIAIKMMDNLSRKKGSTKMALHNDPMLKSLLPVNSDESVLGFSTEGSDMPSTIRSAHETEYNSSSNIRQAMVMAASDLLKAKKMPVGTISKGRKKIAEGKWVPVKNTSGAISNIGKYLYHGANEDVLDSIMEHGLKPGIRGQLSLSKTEEYARSYARDGMTPKGKTRGIVLRVDSNLLRGKLSLNRLDGKSRPESDKQNEVLTKEVIPSRYLDISFDNGRTWKNLISGLAFEKAKASPEGTHSVHGGVKVVKQGHKWVKEKTGRKKSTDPEDIRGSKSGYGTHHIEIGDTLTFKASGVAVSGKVIAEGSKGATVDVGGTFHKVTWASVTGFKGKGKSTSISPAPNVSLEYVDPKDFVANEWASKMDDPDVTKESILAKVEKESPKVREAINNAESRLKAVEQTIHKYRISGEGVSAVYEESREQKHRDIIHKILPPEKFMKAKPEKGQRPVVVMLGGRGGSGKSWLNGQVYDPEKTVVLDADEIKGMLDEYEGWNAFQVHEESSDILEKVMDIAKNYGLNIVVDATLKTPRSAMDNAQLFLASEYDLEVHYMHLPRQMAAERAISRFMGKSNRYVPIDVILGNTQNETTFEMLREYASSWSFYDNSGNPPPKLISEQGRGRFMKALRRIFQNELFKSELDISVKNAMEEARVDANSYDFYDFRTPSNPEDRSDDQKRLIAEYGEIDSKVSKKGESKPELEKARSGTKYLRKFWKNGQWNYVYPENGATRNPRQLPDHTVVKNLGGSTGGALLVSLPNGDKKVLKYSTGSQHLKEEYTANKVYDILGVPVPHVQLKESLKGIGQLADFIPGTPLGELDSDARRLAVESLKNGFVADALLGNWDVLGLEEDNILWDGAKAWRIDNGGSLRYRAQGQPKGEKFGNTVGELQSMRDPYKGAGKRAYSTVTDEQIFSQIDNVLSHKQTILDAIDDLPLRRVMEERINSLAEVVKDRPSVSTMEQNDIGTKLSFTRGSSYPKDLNGVAFKSWAPPEMEGWADVPGQNDSIVEPPLKVKPGLKAASGVVIEEPDGRVWIVSPTNEFGGYKNTFPKGKISEGLSLQANAIKEAFEESGLKVEITGHLIDVDKTTSTTRYYTAKRVDGVPTDMGWESEAVVLVSKTELMDMLNQPVDRKVANALNKSTEIPDQTLVKSESGQWYLYEKGMVTKFYWFHDLEKSVSHKTYYSSDEVKARGMRWVTIHGARVLLQGTADGGYVVVGGAGGKLNHLKVDKVLSREEYAEKRKRVEKKRNEDLRELTKEEVAEQVSQRKVEVAAKRVAREEYTGKVTQILGISQEDLRSQISAQEMDALTDRAKAMVEGRVKDKTVEGFDAKVEATVEELTKKAVALQTKDLERAALQTLMNDYMPGDPNVKPELKKLLDKDKAVQILQARKEFRKAIKAIGKGQADTPMTLRVGDVYAGDSESIPEDIMEEIRQQVETQKNIQLYDRMNAQSESIQTHVDQGSISALNGLLGDVYGSGATFSTNTIENLGLEAVVRAVTIKIQSDGRGEVVLKALEEYSSKEREKVVTKAIAESDKRFANADELRSLARDTDDAEAILSMASANGHALKQLTAGQRALGTAVGSLRAVAAMINALEDPPADVVQVDIGKDLLRARKKAHDAGLPKGSYSIKTLKEGRSKRLVLEIKKEHLDTFFARNEQLRKDESVVAKIKRHEMNDGYLPTGIRGDIKLDDAQEAGLRFFKEKGSVILDFEAGLGKTAVAYAGIAEAIANRGAKKILVVTPAKTRSDFAGQAKQFLEPELASQVHSSTETTTKASRMARHSAESGIHIISQDALREDSEAIKAAGYDMIVVDEIHEMTAGTGQAGRFKSLMDLSGIPLKIAMSGTNIKNKKEELYRKINFIDPGHTLGTMSEFNKRYEGLNQGTGMFADAANDAFRKEISDWVYTQKNVLPIENTVETRRVPLTADQRKRYAESERQYRDDRDSKKPGASAQRDSRNYAIVTNSNSMQNGKLDEMVNIMKTIHPGEKAVIHLSKPGSPVIHAVETAVQRLEKEFGVGSVGVIQGQGEGSSNAAITKLKKRFNDPNDPLRFIIGTKSLESGHNLQHGGTVTFHLDIPDSYAAFQQRNARVFRKGQDRDTHAYVLSGTNPFDMRGEDIMETKRKEQEILGNPRGVESMDDSGFIGMLNRYEKEAAGGL